MAENKDIIDIVKELQLLQQNGWGRNYRAMQMWKESLKEYFPVISQAFFIAVEALEKQRKIEHNDPEPHRGLAHKALAHIESLAILDGEKEPIAQISN